jgi:predicted enzyme related to lactoylglutathione lyase
MKFHFSIPVKDIAESAKFYSGLGFVVVSKWSKPEKKKEAVVMQRDDCVIELSFHPSNKTLDLCKSDNLHLGLEVEYLQKLLDKIEQQGVTITRPKAPGVSVKCFAFIKDPNGFAIELFESN